MKRLTADTDLPFCDIAQCREMPCPYDDSCDQRKCYERLREYERSDLEPESVQKARALLDELKDARQTIELVDACGRRACTGEKHWDCPYGDGGMEDCIERLESHYEGTIRRLLALKETLEGAKHGKAKRIPTEAGGAAGRP